MKESYIGRRLREKKAKKQLDREFEEDEEARQSTWVKQEQSRLDARQRILDKKEQRIALKEREKELKIKEREQAHVSYRAVRRAEKLAEQGFETSKQIPAKATMYGASRLKRTAGRVRVTATTSRLPRDKPGRTRLPVFAEGQPGFAERIALDFGAKEPQDILPSQQQTDILGGAKVTDFGFGNKQYDLGIGNGKKKKTRFY